MASKTAKAPAAPAEAKGKQASAGAAAPNGHADRRQQRDSREARGSGEPRSGGGFVHVAGKPDKEAHEAEIKSIDDEIAKLQNKSNDLRKKLAPNDTKDSPANARREELRSQLNSLRSEQASIKQTRSGILNQIRALTEGISSKSTALKSSRDKSRFRSVAEVDAEIKRLDKQVESGTMRLVDEKKALNEISALRKTRKTVEGFSGQDDLIQADKKQIDELRKQLDAPETKGPSDKYNALREELDKLNSENDAQRSSRQKLYDERDAIKAELDALYEKKRDSRTTFRDASDKYYHKVQEEKRKRQEKERADRLEWQESKRKEENDRLLEVAKQPAYEREIEDCRNLIAFFTKGTEPAGALSSTTAAASNLPQLNLRKVEQGDQPPLGVPLKKKGEDEENFYVGKGGKRNKGRGGAAASGAAAKQSFNIPLPYLSALLGLGIAAPSSQADTPQIVEALNEKRKHFEANQDAETKKRIAEAEKRIANNEAKSREPETVEPAAAATAKPALAHRASEEAEIPAPVVEAPVVEAPKLATGGEAVSSSNALAETPSAAELSAASESTTA